MTVTASHRRPLPSFPPSFEPAERVQIPISTINICFETHSEDAYDLASQASPYIVHLVPTVTRLYRIPKMAESHLRANSGFITPAIAHFLVYFYIFTCDPA